MKLIHSKGSGKCQQSLATEFKHSVSEVRPVKAVAYSVSNIASGKINVTLCDKQISRALKNTAITHKQNDELTRAPSKDAALSWNAIYTYVTIRVKCIEVEIL